MPWTGLGRRGRETAQYGVVLGRRCLALAGIEADGARPRLVAARAIALDAARRPGRALDDLFRGLSLRRPRALTHVLEADAYQLTLMDAPEVEPSELAAALRWRLQEFVELSLDEAVIDAFEVPAPLRGGQGRTLYAVSAAGARVAADVGHFEERRIGVTAVDVRELALRNIAVGLDDTGRGLALVLLDQDHALLVVVAQGMLYLARRIDGGLEELRSAHVSGPAALPFWEGLALEIQRSLDYFESHYDQRPVAAVHLAPGAALEPADLDRLGAGVAVPVRRLDPAALADTGGLEPPADPEFVLALGAAFRGTFTSRAETAA
jgi:MSHA biogenesis protein MshI